MILLGAALTLWHCGPANSPDNNSCQPNVIEQNMALMVNQISGNDYSFQVCQSSLPANAAYTVYGGLDSTGLTQNNFNPRGAIRAPHLSQANVVGAVYQVTFKDSDLYFAIYQDLNENPDNSTVPVISPHRIPSR